MRPDQACGEPPPSYDLMKTHAKQNQELTTLRDWLLPLLMNGRVRVQ